MIIIRFILFVLSLIFVIDAQAQVAERPKTVLLAILARNKAHVLPSYLACIDRLDYNKKAMIVYINTNNNEDETSQILKVWVNRNRKKYRKVIIENHHVNNMKPTKPHQWNAQRFRVLGEIRNKSMRLAKSQNCDYYFVVDCDNFIAPFTLKYLVRKDKPIIAPMLRSIPYPDDHYSNYVCAVSVGGYELDHPDYMRILLGKKVGTFEVPIVHCTYLINTAYIDRLGYVDETPHHEFVVFSRSARRNGVPQYICNEKKFGVLLHHGTKLTLAEEVECVKKLGVIKP